MKNISKIASEIFAFGYALKQKQEAEEFLSKNNNPKDFYIEFIVNKGIRYLEVINIINDLKLPNNFKQEFIKTHKELEKDRKEGFIAQIDKFKIINKYGGSDTIDIFKGVKEFIKNVVQTLKSKNFDLIIYGDIYLQNPRNTHAVAEYNHINDTISLKLFKTYNEHIKKSLIHELAHRIWYKLMDNQDREKWRNEFETKKSGKSDVKYVQFLSLKIKQHNLIEGFPTLYSQTNEQEYFAEVVETYISENKVFSPLVNEIF